MDPARSQAVAPALSALSAEVVDQPVRFAQLEPAWAALLARYPGRTPFATFEWASAWLATLGRAVRLHVIVLRDADRVVAIAPFCIHGSGTLTFIGFPQSDYSDVLVDPDCPGAVQKLVEVLHAHRGQWKRAVLDSMREEGAQWGALETALRAAGLPVRVESADSCPAMILADPAAAKKQYYKKNIANYVNWFKSQGELSFEVHDDEAATLELLEQLFAQHVARWSGTATPSAFLKSDAQEFHRAFVRSMRPRGWLKIAVLRLNQEFLALYLFFELDGVMYLYKPTYSVEHYKHSPGQVMLRYMLDYALERGVREMDLTRGDEGYKSRFANVTRGTRRIILYENELTMRLAALEHSLRHSRAADTVRRGLRGETGASRWLSWMRQRRRAVK